MLEKAKGCSCGTKKQFASCFLVDKFVNIDVSVASWKNNLRAKQGSMENKLDSWEK